MVFSTATASPRARPNCRRRRPGITCASSTFSPSTSPPRSSRSCCCGAACGTAATGATSANASASARRSPPAGVWLHAVSVGEVQACAALVGALRRAHPQLPLTVTTFTPTGAARARALFGNVAQVRYVPFDLPGAVRRFFARVQPRLAVIFETELWPNLYRECGRRRVPLVLASARISERSVSRYRRLGRLFTRHAVARRGGGGAGTVRTPTRFRALGADAAATHVTGNLKFDFELPADIAGARRAAARAVRRAAPGLGRGQHAWRWRGGGAAGRAAAAARQCPRGAAGDRAATPAALRRGRGNADAGRGTLHAPLAQQQCGGRLRGAAAGFPRRAAGFLRRRGRGLCRRQPGGGRGTQPARAGGARRAAPHRPLYLQQRGYCASADRARRRRGGAHPGGTGRPREQPAQRSGGPRPHRRARPRVRGRQPRRARRSCSA